MNGKIMPKLFLTILLIIGTLTAFEGENHQTNDLGFKVAKLNESSEPRVLSRRKRFLTFPDGSSFQLVFCAQNQGYLQIGDVVWFGNTAALAWELPTDPIFYHMLKKYDKKFDAIRREDTRHVIFVDEVGKIISKVPYKRRPIVNPAFAKRSIESNVVNVQKMHEMQADKDHFQGLDDSRIEFHRESRKSLYDQLQKFFKGLGWTGKECIQRLLCENRKEKLGQGAFLEEIFRATFTMPRTSKSSLHKDYDIEIGEGDCKTLYPECRNIQIHQFEED